MGAKGVIHSQQVIFRKAYAPWQGALPAVVLDVIRRHGAVPPLVRG